MSKIGIIGGSGLYDMEALEDKKWIKVKTPFGCPSDELLVAKLGEKEVVFLCRHGRGHKISPSMINYRANIFAMKSLGVSEIISVSACGSLKEELKPLDFVIPDQFLDRTQGRKSTFFDNGVVAHVSFAQPICGNLSQALHNAAREQGVTVHFGGTYINMEGPQFSTLAESNLYRKWNIDIIGMTNATEAKLAREAEICYATLAAVTDYDCWRSSGEEVSVDIILDNLNKNTANAKKILKTAISSFSPEENCPCKSSLRTAIVTRPEFISDATKDNLDIIIGKYIK